MVITDSVLQSRAVDGQVFLVSGEWFYMDDAHLLHYLPDEIVRYIRNIEAMQSIGKVLYFNKPFLDAVNISIVRHTALVKRLLDPTKDSVQLQLSQSKSLFIKDAALFAGKGTLRVQTPDGKVIADITVHENKPVSVNEAFDRIIFTGRRPSIPYGYLWSGSSFSPLEVKQL